MCAENAAQVADAVAHVVQRLDRSAEATRQEQVRQCALLRDILGNPLEHPPTPPVSGPVARIAETIYAERRFADLPILADALEEAGCTSSAILQHCRNDAVHVAGCWVLDLVLGRATEPLPVSRH
jgi:hypothetical protein